MITEMICPLCNSNDVEELLVAYYKVNGDQSLSGDLDLAVNYPSALYYCNGCENHPRKLLTRTTMTPKERIEAMDMLADAPYDDEGSN